MLPVHTPSIKTTGRHKNYSASSYNLHASETQQLANATSIFYQCGVARPTLGSRMAKDQIRSGVARGQISANDRPTYNTL